jgi:predicted CXXCH cytochrome family protein
MQLGVSRTSIGDRDRGFRAVGGTLVRVAILVVALTVLLALTAAPALAFKEGGASIGIDGGDCDTCHGEPWPWFDTRQGPHGNYSTTSNKCESCHTIHVAPSSNQLLPAMTITDTCFACHDGTGGAGVYGSIAARGLSVGGGHRIDTTSTIPGGDWATGGSVSTSFTSESGLLSCGDCHSPHDSNTVQGFRSERIRFHSDELTYGAPDKEWRTSHLLKQKPTSANTATAVYGSDWCAGCHQGRFSGGPTHNHPVDSKISTSTPFHYDYVAVVTSDTSFETTMGTMGLEGTSTPNLYWHNRGFVMPEPRTSHQSGHAPICQQCHEDPREVGEVGAVNPAGVERYGDGRQNESGGGTTDTPRFQNFPHETTTTAMLVEEGDNLCMNCHTVAGLP